MRETIRYGLERGVISKDDWQETYEKMKSMDYSLLLDRQIIVSKEKGPTQ